MSGCALVETPVDLRDVVCPRCLPDHRRVLVRAASGSIVEVYW